MCFRMAVFMKHHLISLVNEDSKAIGLMLAGDLYRGTIENWISITDFDVSLFNVFQMNIIFLTNHEAHTIPSGIDTLPD